MSGPDKENSFMRRCAAMILGDHLPHFWAE